jgi:oxygen-independent coproporphyrinogen-3 oxidase
MRHFRRACEPDQASNIRRACEPDQASNFRRACEPDQASNLRRAGASPAITEYTCQDDGMVGLGCGARSYTRDLHYSFDYAVSVRGVRAVLDDYLGRSPGDFAHAEVGFRLDGTEQRRRWLVKTLLRAGGASALAWRERFGGDMPRLDELHDRGWLVEDGDLIRLTDEGLVHSDAIGPWLVSGAVRAAMREYQPR